MALALINYKDCCQELSQMLPQCHTKSFLINNLFPCLGKSQINCLQNNNSHNISARATMECNSQSDLVSLRDFNVEEDVEDFLAWAGDSQVAKYTTWNPCAAMEEAKQFLVKMQQAVPPHESWFKAVCLNGKPVGHIKLELRTHENGVRYGRIGYALGREYWRRGITSQAVKQCLKIGYTDLNLESVEALVLPENMASIKLLEKVGFQRSVSYYEYVNVKGNIQQCLLYTFHGSHVI